MERKGISILRYTGYTLCGILLALALLHILFPREELYRELHDLGHTLSPHFSFSFQEIQTAPPFGFKMLKPVFKLKSGSAQKFFVAEHVTLHPDLWVMLKNHVGFRYQCKAYGGDLRGRLYFREDLLHGPMEATLQVRETYVGENPLIKHLPGLSVRGAFNGGLSFKKGKGPPLRGSGKGNIGLADVRMDLMEPLFGLDVLRMDELYAEFFLSNREITLHQFALKSPDFDATLTGSIFLDDDLGKSRLGLKGTLSPVRRSREKVAGQTSKQHGLGNPARTPGVSFMVLGTPARPVVTFLNNG
jgi:type II secretion system protein N